jgi:hypothetical protein
MELEECHIYSTYQIIVLIYISAGRDNIYLFINREIFAMEG